MDPRRRPYLPAHVEAEPRRAAAAEQAQDRDAPHWWVTWEGMTGQIALATFSALQVLQGGRQGRAALLHRLEYCPGSLLYSSKPFLTFALTTLAVLTFA